MLTHKNAQAYAVLSLVYYNLNEDILEHFTFAPYVNGREEGFSIKCYGHEGVGLQVSFSENRNSDDIVVYTGNIVNFDAEGNIPDEHAYESRQYFPCGAVERAAKHIIKFLQIAKLNKAA